MKKIAIFNEMFKMNGNFSDKVLNCENKFLQNN